MFWNSYIIADIVEFLSLSLENVNYLIFISLLNS